MEKVTLGSCHCQEGSWVKYGPLWYTKVIVMPAYQPYFESGRKIVFLEELPPTGIQFKQRPVLGKWEIRGGSNS